MKPLALLLFFASFAAAQNCKLPDIPPNGTVDGMLQRTDCLLSDYLKDYPDLRVPAHAWKLVVKKTAVYRIRVASTTMDPFVILADSTGTIVDLDDDSATPDGTDSELLMQITPGEYTVLATVATGALGSYKLTWEAGPIRQCKPVTVTIPADIDGEIASADCRYADLVPMVSSHNSVDTYSFESKQPFILTARMDSTAFDSLLGMLGGNGKVLAFDDNGGGGKNAKLRVSMPAGTTVLMATTTKAGTGFYKFRAESEDRRTCDTRSINPGSSVQGQLELDGCRYFDAYSASMNDSRIARFRFEIRQRVVVRLNANSTDFDPYLMLFDNAGKIVEENDNSSASTSNSALTISLAPGFYTAVVRAKSTGMGAFEFALGTEPVKTCELTELAMPGTTTGALNASQCRYLDVMSPSTSTFAAKIFKFMLDKATFVSLSATGTGYSPLIDIQSPGGELLSTIRLVSKQEQLLLPGEYRLMVWHRTSTGNFTITAETRDPVACPALEITAGSSATGTLNGVDCMLREVVPEPAPQYPADVYTLQLTDPDTITAAVVATKDEFLPWIYLLDADGKIVASGIDSVKLEAKAGTYWIVVTTLFQGGGDYKLTVTGTAAPVQ